jgi:hypothetical protein
VVILTAWNTGQGSVRRVKALVPSGLDSSHAP